jgi:hypothetical protein
MGIKDINSLTIDDIKPITISFKKTEDELNLYKWILDHSGYSGFVKDKLREVKESEGKVNKIHVEQAQSGLIDMDF